MQPGRNPSLPPSSNAVDVDPLREAARDAIYDALAATLGHLKCEDDKLPSMVDLHNRIFIKSLELEALRLCIGQTNGDLQILMDARNELKMGVLDLTPINLLPQLPDEIVSSILLVAHEAEIQASARPEEYSYSNKLTVVDQMLRELHPQHPIRNIALSSMAYVVDGEDWFNDAGPSSAPSSLEVSKLIVHYDLRLEWSNFLPTILQCTDRWKELYLTGVAIDIPALLGGVLQEIFSHALPFLEHFEFMRKIDVDRNDDFEFGQHGFFPDFQFVSDKNLLPRLRSAQIPLVFLEDFATSGFFSQIVILWIHIGQDPSRFPPLYKCISALTNLKALSSLTLSIRRPTVRAGSNFYRIQDDIDRSIPRFASLKALHLDGFPLSVLHPILLCFRSSDLAELSLLPECLSSISESSEEMAEFGLEEFYDSLHRMYPHLKALETAWALESLVDILSGPSADGDWQFTDLRELALLSEVCVTRLTEMLRVRLGTPDVVPINVLRVCICGGQPGSKILTLHEIEKWVPNVMCI